MLTALPDEPLALAVSGGSDSMAMLHLVMQQRPAKSLAVLTVDHGLREGSGGEAEQVGRFCARHGVEHHTLHWLGEKPTTGIQAKARQARYDLMTRWCVERGIRALLTAHTMEDQAETVAMRKLRTSSLKSLAGIWPQSVWNGICIIRPLLQSRREQLRAVLREAGVGWSDDPSNDNLKFERVRVRALLVEPEISELAATADMARSETESCRAAALRWLKAHASIEATGLVRLPRLLLSAFAQEDQLPIMREIIGSSIYMTGGGSPDPNAITSLTRRILSGEAFRITLGGAMVALRRTEILFGREPARIADQPVVVLGQPVLWDGRFRITAPEKSSISAAGPRCPKPEKALPAFVLAGLPAVTLPGGCIVLPHFQPAAGVTTSLGERFRL